MTYQQFEFYYNLASEWFIVEYIDKVKEHIKELDDPKYKEAFANEAYNITLDNDLNLTRVRINALINIVKANKEIDALLKVSCSKNLDASIINKASILLNKMIEDSNDKVK